MMAMLPEWGEISEKEGTNGHATVDKINNVLYCMSKAEFEYDGSFYPRIPDGFNAIQVRAFWRIFRNRESGKKGWFLSFVYLETIRGKTHYEFWCETFHQSLLRLGEEHALVN